MRDYAEETMRQALQKIANDSTNDAYLSIEAKAYRIIARETLTKLGLSEPWW